MITFFIDKIAIVWYYSLNGEENMTQENRDVLYNKQAHELNKKDANYIDKLMLKKDNNFFIKETFIVPPLAFILVPILMSLIGFFSLNLVTLTIMGVVGTLMGGILGGALSLKNISLKSLGLTRKEWKELKKSGRLKELEQILKEYDKSLKSDLDNIYEREEEISSEIQLKEEEKQSLISEPVDLYAEKRAITSEEQTSKYTQEYVADLLKSEENLLMRRLNQLKQEQKMLQENADNKIITESGKRAEQSIDYMQQALKNCQEFNEEFKGETFDN